MAGGISNNKSVEVAGKVANEQVKEGGLAALARKILNAVFRAPEHGKFMDSILSQSNRIFAGTGTKEDLVSTLSKIEDYKKQISKNYSPDVGAIAHNYFSQLEKRLKESFEVKSA